MRASFFLATSVAALFAFLTGVSASVPESWCFSLQDAGAEFSGTWTRYSSNPVIYKRDDMYLFRLFDSFPVWYIVDSLSTAQAGGFVTDELASITCDDPKPSKLNLCKTFLAGAITGANSQDGSFKAVAGVCPTTAPPTTAAPTAPTKSPTTASPTPPTPSPTPLPSDSNCFRMQGMYGKSVNFNGDYQKTSETRNGHPVWRRTDGAFDFAWTTADYYAYWSLFAKDMWEEMDNGGSYDRRYVTCLGANERVWECPRFQLNQNGFDWPVCVGNDCVSTPSFEACSEGGASAFSLFDADCAESVCVNGLEFAPVEYADGCVRRHAWASDEQEEGEKGEMYFLWYDADVSLWVISVRGASRQSLMFMCNKEHVLDCTWTHWVANPMSELAWQNETLVVRSTALWQASNGALDVERCGVEDDGKEGEEESDVVLIVIVVVLVAVLLIFGGVLVVFLCNKRQRKEVSFTHGGTARVAQDEEEALE